MKNIAEQITEGLDRFYKAFQRKRVLKSLEEISATTNEDDVASATAVAALSNNLSKKANQSDLNTITSNLQNQINTKAKWGDENLADGYFDIIGTTGSHDCIFRIWTTKKQLETYIKLAGSYSYKQVWIGTLN